MGGFFSSFRQRSEVPEGYLDQSVSTSVLTVPPVEVREGSLGKVLEKIWSTNDA